MEVLANTKIYKNYQTAIPKEMRERFNLNHDTVIEWGVDDEGHPLIEFRKKVTLKDVIGMVDDDDKRNSVELKRSLYEWKKY